MIAPTSPRFSTAAGAWGRPRPRCGFAVGRRANLLGDAIEAGRVATNSFAISSADAPFGGVKDSGFCSEGGSEGFESYCVTKAIRQA